MSRSGYGYDIDDPLENCGAVDKRWRELMADCAKRN